MASSSSRNQGPAVAAAAQPETGEWRAMTGDDVDDFMQHCERVMSREEYREFDGILGQIHSIGATAIWYRMKVLLSRHPDPKRHLNMFLRPHQKLSLTDDVDPQEEALTDSLNGSVID